jgi:3-oxoacyl-(acyl-carrier-protein) synthase
MVGVGLVGVVRGRGVEGMGRTDRKMTRTTNFLPTSTLSATLFLPQAFCASAARAIALSTSAAVGYVLVTSGACVCGVRVVWVCASHWGVVIVAE